MPYKDPERKRQWEQEHREKRNARRRRAASKSASDFVYDDALTPNSIALPPHGSVLNVVVGPLMGIVFFLALLIVIRRLGSSPTPLQPDLESRVRVAL